jgi:hypothetical protein
MGNVHAAFQVVPVFRQVAVMSAVRFDSAFIESLF